MRNVAGNEVQLDKCSSFFQPTEISDEGKLSRANAFPQMDCDKRGLTELCPHRNSSPPNLIVERG